jgi:hypothetical protein
VDFNHYAGSQTVNVTDIGLGQSDAGLGATRLGSSDGNLGRYRQAAYLASLFDSWESLGYGADQRTVWSGIHSAIWSLMTLDPIGGTSYALRDQIIDDHGADGLAFSGDGWYLLSPDGNYNGQEMLIRGPASTVPEPSTYLLMATGLLLLAAFGRKRMKQFGEA